MYCHRHVHQCKMKIILPAWCYCFVGVKSCFLFPNTCSTMCNYSNTAFRGSVDATNARTDLKYSLVPLLDQIIGVDSPPFRVSASGVRIEDGGGWLWNVATEANRTVSCFSPTSPLEEFQCMPFRSNSKKTVTPFSAVSKGAMAVLSATPVARNTLPCIHEGFSEVYAVLRRKVIESVLPVFRRQLANALQKSKDDSENVPLNLPKIYVTGHSLGGSRECSPCA